MVVYSIHSKHQIKCYILTRNKIILEENFIIFGSQGFVGGALWVWQDEHQEILLPA